MSDEKDYRLQKSVNKIEAHGDGGNIGDLW
jgi:hypothetical protein